MYWFGQATFTNDGQFDTNGIICPVDERFFSKETYTFVRQTCHFSDRQALFLPRNSGYRSGLKGVPHKTRRRGGLGVHGVLG